MAFPVYNIVYLNILLLIIIEIIFIFFLSQTLLQLKTYMFF